MVCRTHAFLAALIVSAAFPAVPAIAQTTSSVSSPGGDVQPPRRLFGQWLFGDDEDRPAQGRRVVEQTPQPGMPSRITSDAQDGVLPAPGLPPQGQLLATTGAIPPNQQPGQQGMPGASASAQPGVQPMRPPGAVGAPHAAPTSVMTSLPPEDQPETGAPAELAPNLKKQLVDFTTKEPVGTIVVDTANTYLYLVLPHGKALRYGIRVGREGFTWTGTERITKMKEWPDWFPPAEMIERQPYLPRMTAGGPGNPLGARAMYLGKTVYRIHGTNQPSTIGKFVSSGCIGMLNEDVEDLYNRVQVGTRVVVLPGHAPATASAAPSAQPNGQHAAPAGHAAAVPQPTAPQIVGAPQGAQGPQGAEVTARAGITSSALPPPPQR
jgi:lipoprotein-anchoring transpeptidase ErfK/SrfK